MKKIKKRISLSKPTSTLVLLDRRHSADERQFFKVDRSRHILNIYLHRIIHSNTDSCPVCNGSPYDVAHVFNCLRRPTTLTKHDLWHKPTGYHMISIIIGITKQGYDGILTDSMAATITTATFCVLKYATYTAFMVGYFTASIVVSVAGCQYI